MVAGEEGAGEDADPEEDGEEDADADAEEDGDVLADGEDDGDVLPEGDADGDDDAGRDVLGSADGDVAGVAAGELPGGGVTNELKKLDPAGDTNALGAIEAEGAAGEGGRGVTGAADAGAGVVATTPAPACGWRWLAEGVRSAPIMAKAATPEAATSTPLTNAEASGREMRCRPRRLGCGWPKAASIRARPLSASARPLSASAWPIRLTAWRMRIAAWRMRIAAWP